MNEKKRKLKAEIWLAKDKVQIDIALEFNDEKLLKRNAKKNILIMYWIIFGAKLKNTNQKFHRQILKHYISF